MHSAEEMFVRTEQSGQSYTVHGDAVNLAARLEALCKERDKSLLLSAATAKALSAASRNRLRFFQYPSS